MVINKQCSECRCMFEQRAINVKVCSKDCGLTRKRRLQAENRPKPKKEVSHITIKNKNDEFFKQKSYDAMTADEIRDKQMIKEHLKNNKVIVAKPYKEEVGQTTCYRKR